VEKGLLSIILHAHLPYVRHPEQQDPLEESWLAEAITESYVPLLLVMERLVEEGIDFRLTFSLTPTLVSMLLDPFLQSRYLQRIDRLIELAEKEVERTRPQPLFHRLALMYHRKFSEIREAYVNRYRRDLVAAFKKLQELGKVEIIASAATHGYLPLLAVNSLSVKTQIRVGIEHYQQVFGRQPKGFWLPECAYYPGVEKHLDGVYGIRFTILETHGITRALPRPKYGVYAPVFSPCGVAFFGRDPESSKQVWSAAEGYPGDPDYREFYRDIAYDLNLEYLRPYIYDGIRMDTGIKYHRVTGKGQEKEIYVSDQAERKTEIHAEHFLRSREDQVHQLSTVMDRPPIVVAPYDAELFGHWWFEGPRWLDWLLRKAAGSKSVRILTPSEYLDRYPVNQVAAPAASSWGNKGFNEVWLNSSNDWIYPHLHRAGRVMEELGHRHGHADGLVERALNQAARELLLAQSSDWAFIMNARTVVDYATRRIRAHLSRLNHLCSQIQTGCIDEGGLTALEAQDNIFDKIATARDFRAEQEPSRSEPPTRALELASSSSSRAATRLKRVTAAGQDSPAFAGLQVAMVTPEVVPFAKTGGLADMVGSLAAALAELGARVSVIVPAHRSLLRQSASFDETGIRLIVPVSNRTEEAAILKGTAGGEVAVYAIRADRYFDRDRLYDAGGREYPDNAERFTFLSRAALQLLPKVGVPDVIQCHDWQSALTVVFLKAQPQHYPRLASTKALLTVHNAGYQGLFASGDWHLLNLDRTLFSAQHMEFYGKINFLKGGLLFADAITTVSPTYAEEIKTSELGFGLEGVFRDRAAKVFGILNGADYQVWNPATDPHITKNYDAEDVSGKLACKAELQRGLGLRQRPEVPLLGMVSRLAAQKGMDILKNALETLLERDVQFVLLGSGDPQYQESFASLPARRPGKAAVRIGFDEPLAHQIEAGADMFLMPSRYEPSGLTQIYSLKYGTIPIVRATGGLRDSVQEFDPAVGSGTGFLFRPYEPGALLAAVDRALAAFARKPDWAALMKNAMTADFSWERSAREYLRLYGRLLGREPRTARVPSLQVEPA
jgi:1,4-alpha-glucan branching enzyme